jgi:anti-anti-sigma factor
MIRPAPTVGDEFVQLSLDHRLVGDADVVTCVGRITAGAEATALQNTLDSLSVFGRHIVLHLGGVGYIDSVGLGLLVRNLMHTRHAAGSLKVCAVSPKIDELLRITRLKGVFPRYESEEAAIADVHRTDEAVGDTDMTILCVDESAEVGTYLRELLKAAGYYVLTAQNLADALILLVATRPKIVVISAGLAKTTSTRPAAEFHRLASARTVVELPEGFSGLETGAAGQDVLRAVAAAS